jgi:hypothetical protein
VHDAIDDFIGTLDDASLRQSLRVALVAYSSSLSSPSPTTLPAATKEVVLAADIQGCQHQFRKGKRAGEFCGLSVRADESMCRRHRATPRVSVRTLEIDLSRVEEEVDEEIYLSPFEEKDEGDRAEPVDVVDVGDAATEDTDGSLDDEDDDNE